MGINFYNSLPMHFVFPDSEPNSRGLTIRTDLNRKFMLKTHYIWFEKVYARSSRPREV